ncbi:MAG TPA: D-alanine--D-alanine ligase [Candidatus Omnitrophota bacterium]|nr:D-alanine--D-alanine ligase [Candidatus Omnitrophota bacterium]HPD85107.1 D-alanine--D-alanine ligase [Candidatus Omnitrophota bacterium]HRZ03965.1 D-alanine--D-alanine ligase [Candidatus Omnitrophota bacterium]
MNGINQFGHIGILMGGCSSEREISLKSGTAIYNALKNCNCQVTALDIASEDEARILSLVRNAGIDVAFIALHGRLGEDGTIQSILEKAKIPYTGSGVTASRLALNKVSAQNIFRKNNIPVPDYIVIRKKDSGDSQKFLDKVNGFPVVVKPANQGSSIGITLVKEKKDLTPALKLAFQYDDEILIERYISGRELTVGILDETPLPVIEIKPKGSFFDFESKYQPGMAEHIVPAVIPPPVAKAVQDFALKAHQSLGCRHLSRVDVLLDKENNPYVIEINTIPGFTATSLLPDAAKHAGLDFSQLCLKLIALAYGK